MDRGSININTGSLFEDLKIKLGCMYLSDIRIIYKNEAIMTLSSIKTDNYSLTEWNDIAHYLSGCKNEFNSAKDAHEFIISYLFK